MKNISDVHGRALEYAIVEEINRRLSSSRIQFTQRALQAQQRDFQKYLSLSPKMQHSYQKCAEIVFAWLDNNFSILNQSILVEVDRLPDHLSRQGDVTDIRLTLGSQVLNLSVKHNHIALKHQRPASTAQHCGYKKSSQEDVQFRQEYRDVTNLFWAIAQDYSCFRDLNQGVVLKHLYVPICELVAKFINSFCQSQIYANHLFTFLVGKTDFYKIIFHEQQGIVEVQSFNQLSPINFVTAQSNQNYVNLQFSNAWQISMRLHTASSRIKKNPSLKFDTQPVNIVVPKQKFIV